MNKILKYLFLKIKNKVDAYIDQRADEVKIKAECRNIK